MISARKPIVYLNDQHSEVMQRDPILFVMITFLHTEHQQQLSDHKLRRTGLSVFELEYFPVPDDGNCEMDRRADKDR